MIWYTWIVIYVIVGILLSSGYLAFRDEIGKLPDGAIVALIVFLFITTWPLLIIMAAGVQLGKLLLETGKYDRLG